MPLEKPTRQALSERLVAPEQPAALHRAAPIPVAPLFVGCEAVFALLANCLPRPFRVVLRESLMALP